MSVNVTLKPVESSSVASIGYDDQSKTMIVNFKVKGGGLSSYQYFNIDRSDYEILLGTGVSVGSKLKEVIAGKTYEKM